MARKEIESAAEDRAEGYKEEPGERSRNMKGKSKVIKKSSPVFVKGGTGHMVGKQSVGTKTPGTTSPGGKGGGKFIGGGSGHMVGKQTASPAKKA